MGELRILENLDLFWFFHNSLKTQSTSSSPSSSLTLPPPPPSFASVEQTHFADSEVPVNKDPKPINPLQQTQNVQPTSGEIRLENSSGYHFPIQAPSLENGALRIPEPSKRTRKKNRYSGSKRGTRGYRDLEIEEVKGFMDLGFTFGGSEGNGRLVSIIPGLQRLGKRTVGFQRAEIPLLHMRIPDTSDGMAMKEHLKVWAHAVACTVK